MEPSEFESKIRAVAEVKDRPIDIDGVRIRHYAYKDYGGMTVDSLKPCEGNCPDCGKKGMCNPKRNHQYKITEQGSGWQSYCCGCGLYKNRVSGRYEIKSVAGKKTIL
jgi:hypothetical protein